MSAPTSVPADRTVGDVAAEAAVTPSAVRFYEQHGLVTAVRTAGNQRRFTETAACRIKVAKVAQRVGLTVQEIVALFATLPEPPRPEDWGRVSAALIAAARRRVDALERTLSDLGSDTRLCALDG